MEEIGVKNERDYGKDRGRELRVEGKVNNVRIKKRFFLGNLSEGRWKRMCGRS